jgi:hypothetical protein
MPELDGRNCPPTDPQQPHRWSGTLRAVERTLVEDSLVFRYEVEGVETDGLKGVEGTFSLCSFWYIDAFPAREPLHGGTVRCACIVKPNVMIIIALPAPPAVLPT